MRELLKRILPGRLVERIRRRNALRRYLHDLSDELLERDTHLEDLEERVLETRPGLYARIVRDVVDRTDLIVKELDRRIEGQGARHADRLRALEEEMARLREAVEELRAALGRDAPEPAASAE